MKKIFTIVCSLFVAIFLLGCSLPEDDLFDIDVDINVETDTSNSSQASDDATSSNNNEESVFQKDELNIYFMYVGQADSILVDCNGEYALIDCGNSADGKLIVDYLNELGVDELKYLFISHPHEDHMGGAAYVIENMTIKNCIMPDRTVNTKVFENMIDALLDKDVNTIFPEVKDTFNLGEGTFTVLSCDNDAKDINATSIVTLFTYGDIDVLFTGDATTDNEDEILSWYEFNDVEVLKVPHHGSKTSNSKNYLEAINPETLIISVGVNNSYGLPKDEILKRLESLNATLYRTDQQGTIILTGNKNDYSIFVDGSNYDGDSEGNENFGGNISISSSSNLECSKEEASFCASMNGSKYHTLDCSHANKINEENIIYFATEEDAIDAGYEPCSQCLD